MTHPKEQEAINDNAPNEETMDASAARIAELEAELAKMKDQWVRAAAETENVRKRAERDQQETARYASAKFARDMVDVLENVKRAADSVSADKRAENELLKTVGDGLDMTASQLEEIFARHGVKRIDPMGEKFDHNLHQAVVQVDQPGAEPGTVVQVVQAGYVLHDRLLRPAMVAVTKGDAKKIDTNA